MKPSIRSDVGMPEDSTRSLDPEVWVDTHGDYLYRYALLRLHNTELAEDVVQETLLAALKSRERYQGRATVRTWLIGILKHKVIDTLRKRYRERPLSEFEMEDKSYQDLFDEFDHWKQGSSSWRADPLELASRNEFVDVLSKCMSNLPDRLAQAFSLRVLEGRDTKEVCKIINVTTTNLNVMLHRARVSLKHCLEVNWFD